jgi:hypothetical protein
MKLSKKSLFASIAFMGVALCASTASANIAPALVAAGSTAMFQVFAQSARSTTATTAGACGNHIWTKKNGAQMVDTRSLSINNEVNNVWVVWDDTPEPNRKVCLYEAVDSAVGVRGFMAVPKANLQILAAFNTGAAAGDNLIQASAFDEVLPTNIFTDINGSLSAPYTGSTMNAAPTDVRPEDAQYATWRALVALPAGAQARSGLGYGNPSWTDIYNEGAPIGVDIHSSFSAAIARPVNFHIGFTSTDPITGSPQSSWNTANVGAAPIVVIVSNNSNVAGHFGSQVSGSWVFNNANRFQLSQAFDGTFGLTRDLLAINPNIDANTGIPSALTPAVPMTIITREPLSGTYNTFEFSVPRTHDVQLSQEDYVDPSLANNNPLNILTTEAGTQFLRLRAIGTGEMAKAVAGFQAVNAGINAPTPDKLGYLFWGYGNVTNTYNPGNITGYNVHYLKIDGTDPLFDHYTDGNLPQCNPTGTRAINPPCPTISFPHVADGSYSAWNVLRVVSGGGAPFPLLQTILNDMNTQVALTSDFLPIGSLGAFRIHRGSVSGIGPRNGHECPYFETGSDVGGAIYTIQSDIDYFLSNGGAYNDCGAHEIYNVVQ